MRINKTLFFRDLNQFHKLEIYNQLIDQYGIDIISLAHKAENIDDLFDIQQIIPEYNLDESDFYNWAVKTMAICKIAMQSNSDFPIETFVIDGDYELSNQEQPKIVFGNLTVKGNFTNKSKLIVLGNMDISGFWLDTNYDYSEAVITGNLIVGSSILTEGNLAIGGNLDAKLAFLSFNQGFTTILGDCNASILLEKDHGGSCIFGLINSAYLVFDELRMINIKNSNRDKLIKNLQTCFNPVLLKELDMDEDKEEYEIYENLTNILFEALSEGKPVLK